MGSGIARLVLRKKGLELVGAYGRRRARAGMDLGRAIGLDRDLGLPLSGDLARPVEEVRPDVAIQATCSRLADAAPEITALARRGVHVISIAEEMAYPAARHPKIAEDINRLAVAQGAVILGTGVNPSR
jgi:4-hydroxy-tetrahydrodipicolinate reductase